MSRTRWPNCRAVIVLLAVVTGCSGGVATPPTSTPLATLPPSTALVTTTEVSADLQTIAGQVVRIGAEQSPDASREYELSSGATFISSQPVPTECASVENQSDSANELGCVVLALVDENGLAHRLMGLDILEDAGGHVFDGNVAVLVQDSLAEAGYETVVTLEGFELDLATGSKRECDPVRRTGDLGIDLVLDPATGEVVHIGCLGTA